MQNYITWKIIVSNFCANRITNTTNSYFTLLDNPKSGIFFPFSGITTFRCNNSDNEFHCDETKCIPKLKVCNGIPDCENGEDEHVRHCGMFGCFNYICLVFQLCVRIRNVTGMYVISGCLPNEFRCSNSCIDILSRCDRNRDCENGEDEEHCGKLALH